MLWVLNAASTAFHAASSRRAVFLSASVTEEPRAHYEIDCDLRFCKKDTVLAVAVLLIALYCKTMDCAGRRVIEMQ